MFVGGGYAGVEALGELEDLARDALETYPDVDGSQMRWVLVDAADRILPELPEALATYAAEQLRERGIEILAGTRLASAEDGAIRLSNGDVPGRDARVDRGREAVTARPRLRPAGRRRRSRACRSRAARPRDRERGRRGTRRRFPTRARAG